MAVDSGSFSPISSDTNPYTQITRKSLERNASVTDGIQVNDFGGDEEVYASALQLDGKLLVLVEQDDDRFILSRYKADGSLDTSFAEQGRIVFGEEFFSWSYPVAVMEQKDGRILVVSQGNVKQEYFTGDSGHFSTVLWRYFPDGTLDTSFGDNGVFISESDAGFGNAVQQEDDSILLVGGSSSNVAMSVLDKNGNLNSNIGYRNSTSDIETSSSASSVVSLPDGKFLLLGNQSDYVYHHPRWTVYDNNLLIQRHNADGSLDTGFANDGRVITDLLGFSSQNGTSVESIQDAVLLANGQILVVGRVHVKDAERVTVWTDDSGTGLAVLRYNGDGSIDTSFADTGLQRIDNPDQGMGYSEAVGVSVTVDNKIIVAARSIDQNADFVLYRLNSDGSIDSTYGVDGRFTYSSKADELDYLVSHEVQSDGSVLLVGHNPDDIVVLRVDTDGVLDTTFAPISSSSSSDVVDGRIVTTELTTDGRGSNVSIISVAPLDGTNSPLSLERVDSQGNQVLSIQLPYGVGVTNTGQQAAASAHTNSGNLNDKVKSLGLSAEARALSGAASYVHETEDGDSWLDTVVLQTEAGTSIDEAVLISGIQRSAADSDNNQILVIDAAKVGSDIEVQVNNIGFTVVEHSLTVHTDDANQVVVGGVGEQHFVLGQGDDQAYVGGGADTVVAGAGDDVVYGGAGNDSLSVASGNNQLYGEQGDDAFFLGANQDLVIAGLGTDTVSFTGNLGDYDIDHQDSVMYVSNKSDPNNVATLVNVEQLSFADQTLTVSYDSNNYAIATLYQQILGREADVGGFNHWSAQMDQGLQLGDTALFFLRSFEYSVQLGLRHGASFDELSVDQQVEELYLGILGRESDSGGKAHWVNSINQGASVRDVATSFAESVELIANYIPVDQWNFDEKAWLYR